MMTATLSFPDLEQAAEDMAAPLGYACKFLPDDFDARLERGEAVILVARVGGKDDGVTDRALIQFAVYGQTRTIAWDTARALQTSVKALEYGGQVGDIWIDSTATAAGRIQVPDVDPDDRRVITIYQLDARRQ